MMRFEPFRWDQTHHIHRHWRKFWGGLQLPYPTSQENPTSKRHPFGPSSTTRNNWKHSAMQPVGYRLHGRYLFDLFNFEFFFVGGKWHLNGKFSKIPSNMFRVIPERFKLTLKVITILAVSLHMVYWTSRSFSATTNLIINLSLNVFSDTMPRNCDSVTNCCCHAKQWQPGRLSLFTIHAQGP